MYIFSKEVYLEDLIKCGYPEAIKNVFANDNTVCWLHEDIKKEYKLYLPVKELHGHPVRLNTDKVTGTCKGYTVSLDWCKEVSDVK